MRFSWFFYALGIFIIGVIFSITIIGLVLGIPLMIIAAIVFVIGCFLPAKEKKVIVEIRNVNRKKNK